jgi:hypothetical protein
MEYEQRSCQQMRPAGYNAGERGQNREQRLTSDRRLEEFRLAPLVRNREVQFAHSVFSIPLVHRIPPKFRWKPRDAASAHPGTRFRCERVNSEIVRLPHRSKE